MKNRNTQLLKTFETLLAILLLICLHVPVMAADTYPSRPIRLIVPFPPGGGTDLVARVIAPKLSERLGKQVIVDNRGGAGGVIGTEMAAKADPDGYTLILVDTAHSIQSALQKLPYDPTKSFSMIAKVVGGPCALVVHPSVPANSVRELIALAKKKPGQLIFATSGIGGNVHMSAELFKIMANIDIKIVHFKGSGPAMVDLIGGHSNAFFNSLIEALPYINSGSVRVIGNGGLKRSASLPDVPTIDEAGLPGFQSTSWRALLAPAGMPSPVVDRLTNEMKVILASAEVKKRFLDGGVYADYLGPAELGTFLREEISRWSQVTAKANIKLEK
jgi:tripartite-type tricarboxylate transporter receptor subunit TctC